MPIFKAILGAPKCRFFFSYPGFLSLSAIAMVGPAHPGTLIVMGPVKTIREPSWRYLLGNVSITPIDFIELGPLDHQRPSVIYEVSEVPFNNLSGDVMLGPQSRQPSSSLDGSTSGGELSPSQISTSIWPCSRPPLSMYGHSTISAVVSCAREWGH